MRLHTGERQKAARGELRIPLPAGLIYAPAGGIMINPDAQIQARIEMVFDSFLRLGIAKAVVRRPRKVELALPVRPLRAPAPHEVVWRDATDGRIRNILKNPAYAGAYVYGRRCAAPERRCEGVKTPTRAVPRDEWEVCIQNAHPAYISWETHMAIDDKLADNVGNFKAGHRGMPRKGKALCRGS